MPYIEERYRQMASYKPISVGELNYAMSKAVNDYITELNGINYKLINSIKADMEIFLQMYIFTSVMGLSSISLSMSMTNKSLVDTWSNLVQEYCKDHADREVDTNVFNDIIGAISEVRDEFREVVVKPYEEKKRLANGPVYDVKEKSL